MTVDETKDPEILSKNVLVFLRKQKRIHSVEDIANGIDAAPKRVRRALELLRKKGHTLKVVENQIELNSYLPPNGKQYRIPSDQLRGNKFKFLLTADNHLCNKHERLDVLNALFDIAQREGISTCYQLGNMIDGDHHFNKHEVYCVGLEKQSEYLLQNWPQRKGLTTHFITGDDHEGWYINRDNVDVGFYIEQKFERAGRNDFKYLGHVEADILLPGRRTRSTMRLVHAGGGSTYATSYTTQKIVESYQGGEKPRILCVGHYHKANFDYAREVYTFQGGCTCDQTTFMRKKRIAAHFGGWIIELTIANDGNVIKCQGTWIPFYDKLAYYRPWSSRGVR